MSISHCNIHKSVTKIHISTMGNFLFSVLKILIISSIALDINIFLIFIYLFFIFRKIISQRNGHVFLISLVFGTSFIELVIEIIQKIKILPKNVVFPN